MILKVLVFLTTLVLAVCLLTTDKEEFNKEANDPVRYCQQQTPCAWKVYNYIDYPEVILTNKYCVCRAGQKCQLHVHHFARGYGEFRCKINKDLR